MVQRFFFAVVVVFSSVCPASPVTAQEDTSPFARVEKPPPGLGDLLSPKAGAKKADLPAPEARQEALRSVRELFGRPADAKRRALLVQELIKAGREDNSPTDRYAAIRHAGELALRSGDLTAAEDAASALGQYFDVDVLAIKAALLERLFGKVPHRELLTSAAGHFDEALAADNFEAAVRFRRVGYKAAVATKNKQQIATMRQSVALLKARKAAFDALKPALATLKEKPDDAAANLQIGEYLCFLRGDWERGLPLLVKGGHAIANQEAAAAGDPAVQWKAADAWWDLGQTKTGPARDHIIARAVSQYQKVLPTLKGLTKIRIQRRVDAVLLETGAIVRNDSKTEKRETSGRGKDARDQRAVYLDDLKEVSHEAYFFGTNGATGFPKSHASQCKIRGEILTHAIALHPRSKSSAHVIYDLGGSFSSLVTGVGILEGAPDDSKSPLTFKVYGDGKVLWQSRPLQKRNDGQDCRISVRGVRQLKLEVNCPGSANWAWAAWINPVISK